MLTNSSSSILPKTVLYELEFEPSKVGFFYGQIKFIDNSSLQYCTY